MGASAGDVEVVDRREQGRFEILVDGSVAGFADYRSESGRRAFTHTVVDDAYEGQGLGSKLVSAALDATRAEGLKVAPHCSFVRSYIERHPDLLDLVDAGDRETFGLPAGE